MTTSEPVMYARIDDELLDHPKMAIAGHAIGRNGRAIALGIYVAAILWCNRQGMGGVIPVEVLDQFRTFVVSPATIADALVVAGLFEKHTRGYLIHDYADYNLTAQQVKRQRKDWRDRKRAQRSGNGQT